MPLMVIKWIVKKSTLSKAHTLTIPHPPTPIVARLIGKLISGIHFKIIQVIGGRSSLSSK
jgi:hypothetical protein